MTMFSEEACRLMINMFDVNMTGTIDINEFGRLFTFINEKKRMFESHDRNKEGTLSQVNENNPLVYFIQYFVFRMNSSNLFKQWDIGSRQHLART